MEAFMSTLPEPMQINGTFVFVLVTLIVLFLLVKKFYVDAYTNIMEKRHDIIDGAERKYMDVEVLYSEKMDYFEKELKKARANAGALRERLVAEARSEKEMIVTGARKQALDQKEKTVTELSEVMNTEKAAAANYVDNLAQQIAEQMLGRGVS